VELISPQKPHIANLYRPFFIARARAPLPTLGFSFSGMKRAQKCAAAMSVKERLRAWLVHDYGVFPARYRSSSAFSPHSRAELGTRLPMRQASERHF